MSRTYVVTGAASGIGASLAEQLREAEHTVIGVDLHTVDVQVDLSTDEGRSDLVSEVARLSGGSIDAVVAVAGLVAQAPATVGVNYFGALASLEGLRLLLAGSRAPRAALVASLAALDPTDPELVEALLAGDEPRALQVAGRIAADPVAGATVSIYNATKQALVRWVRASAAKPAWAGASIPLNAIAPGLVHTPMIADILATDEGLAAMVAAAPAPLNGPTAPASAPAKLLAWLVGEENTHVTGQVIYIDGGADSIRRPEAF